MKIISGVIITLVCIGILYFGVYGLSIFYLISK